MCNNLPEISKDMRDAVNAVYGKQERTRAEVRALAKTLGEQAPETGPKLKASTRALLSGTSPS